MNRAKGGVAITITIMSGAAEGVADGGEMGVIITVTITPRIRDMVRTGHLLIPMHRSSTLKANRGITLSSGMAQGVITLNM